MPFTGGPVILFVAKNHQKLTQSVFFLVVEILLFIQKACSLPFYLFYFFGVGECPTMGSAPGYCLKWSCTKVPPLWSKFV
jgi:hypothetical protein